MGFRFGSVVARRAIDLKVRVLLIAVHGLRTDLRNVSSFIDLSPTHPPGPLRPVPHNLRNRSPFPDRI